MNMIRLISIFLIAASCSVSGKDPQDVAIKPQDVQNTTLSVPENSRHSSTSIWVSDNITYINSINKPYLAVFPVREYQGEFYFVDNNGYIMLNYKVRDWVSGYGYLGKIPYGPWYSFVPKHAYQHRIDMPPYATHVVVYLLGAVWTSHNICQIGAVAPNEHISNSKKSMLEYMIPVEQYSSMSVFGYWRFDLLLMQYRVYRK